jgi:predicted nuclease of restriction endonuclease-like (RecB) superfamily
MNDHLPDLAPAPDLLADLRRMIEETRSAVATTVNAGLTMLYWRMGQRINEEILKGERAEYGQQIVVTVIRQLSPDLVLKDPYLLDFLGVRDHYYERDLEDAILREIESFLLELGAGFAFLARQKRIQVDSDDFYIDLLFYNRRLRRLVAIDLKLDDFQPGDKGPMELYLRWLDKYERQPGEEPPLGIILCAGKKQEQIELLEMDKSGIHVAEYLTEVLPREALAQRLHAAIQQARARLALNEEVDEA